MTDKAFKHIIFGVCMIISCFTFSCTVNKEIAKILTEMESKPLKMCINDMPCYLNGQDTIGYLPQDYKYLMVVNVDSSSCTPCRVTHVTQWNDWIDLANKTCSNFAILFIFQPKNGEEPALVNRLKRYSGYFYKKTPFYLDKEGKFLNQNFSHKIPLAMQTMLLNDSNKVVVVGNPNENEDISKQITETINN